MLMSKTDEYELNKMSSDHSKILKRYKGNPGPDSLVFHTDEIVTEQDYKEKFGDEKRYG